MGTIIFENDLGKNTKWYTSNLKRFKWIIAIVYRDNIFYRYEKEIDLVEIRKFIENELCGDILIMDKRITKKIRTTKWNDTGMSSIDYFLLNFDEESDLLAFKLKFYDISISESELSESVDSYIDEHMTK